MARESGLPLLGFLSYLTVDISGLSGLGAVSGGYMRQKENLMDSPTSYSLDCDVPRQSIFVSPLFNSLLMFVLYEMSRVLVVLGGKNRKNVSCLFFQGFSV